MRQRAAFHWGLAGLLGGLLLFAWGGDIRQPSALERIRDRGELAVGVRLGPGIYYETENGARGFEYELLQRFADALDLTLTIEPIAGIGKLAEALETGVIDLAAAGLGPTTEGLESFIFSSPFMETRPVVVYRYGDGQPHSVEDLLDRRIEVIAGSYHEERLLAWRERYPELSWHALDGKRPEELLSRVWHGEADVALTDSHNLAVHRPFYPELRLAFELDDARPLAWMLRPDAESVRAALDDFLTETADSGVQAVLEDEYYGHLDSFDYVGTRTFLRHITERLPEYRAFFEAAGEAERVDWRLLAAMGYQESLWDPAAVSPTGVRGIMMLTLPTAEQVGVDNRLDPQQSISGGAAYLVSVRERLPERIVEPNRTWFALAAYNVGLGHLEDARIITERQGADPDSWTAVRERLPLLSEEQWYSQTRYGYARGSEPVQYVENIRRYYELLIRVNNPGLIAPARNDTDAATPSSDWGFSDEIESAL